MARCKECGEEVAQNPVGAPKKFCNTRCKDKWRYYNSPKRQATLERSKDRRREGGYHKKFYADNIEHQRARCLAYYYENREGILEKKRTMSEDTRYMVDRALDLLNGGLATVEDAEEWDGQNLGWHCWEVDAFIGKVLYDEE